MRRLPLCCLVLCVPAPGAAAQSLVPNSADIPASSPANDSWTENVDFGDVDGDGDWDAVFADGSDIGNDQNRIWINQGGLQGGTLGVFLDETATRFPAVLDQSRDIEFVDFDADGDLDLQISNTSSLVGQPNRFWVNVGGAQGGTEGFYVDETATRWVGLGGAGSSVAPALVLAGGGFIDYSCDSDFGDLDGDGDMDLVHSSYGGVFSGQVPTRLFLNDGAGFFAEFNPSGFQLAGGSIMNGNPGLWCEGTQQANTTDATGAFCDVASSALDVELGDGDGDLDLDLLHGARQELPRWFTNRLEENGGLLGFRDTTGLTFPAGYSTGEGHYEQEMGDMDGDGDLDVYGVNWHFVAGFVDVTGVGNGDGTFSQFLDVTSSSNDDNEADLFDVDQDGDLDVFVAAWLSANRLYRNDGGAGFGLHDVVVPFVRPTALDADAADVDGDGDTDVFVAITKWAGGNGANLYYENLTQTPDTHAPLVVRLEQAPDRVAGPAPTAVRVQVYDNAPYYVTWYDDVRLEVRVGAGPVFTLPMCSSGGQVFRGEIPGGFVGTIRYRAVASDEYGNTSQTAELSYLASGPAPTFCDATDGALASCPCAQGLPDTGCETTQGTGGARALLEGQDLGMLQATIAGSGFPPALAPTVVAIRANDREAAPVVFGDGLRCVGLSGIVRLAATAAAGGASTHAFGHGAGPGSFHYQLFFRSTPASYCDATAAFNLSNGLSLTW